ncbi:GNAT family N-acetyltransferase [Roseivivax sp. CAU 1761]
MSGPEMDCPSAARLLSAIDATWPPAAFHEVPGFRLREGRGGGKRVSAATALSGWRPDDIAGAESAMRGLSQTPLFMLRAGEDALDEALAARGYTVIDPVEILVAPLARLTDVAVPRVTAFALWEPLAIMREIWAAGGIGPERLAVMARAAGPKTALLGRLRDKPGGAGFCAIHDGIAMMHALEVRPALRRQGMAGWMTRQAAFWARENGAEWMAALVVRENRAAQALYARLGFAAAGGYHYRIKEEPRP